MKAVVAAFNQEKALVGAFSVITNLRMQLLEALVVSQWILGGVAGALSLSVSTVCLHSHAGGREENTEKYLNTTKKISEQYEYCGCWSLAQLVWDDQKYESHNLFE